MSRYVHHIPGRMRVRCRTFRSNPHRIGAVAAAIEEVPGVREVTAKAASGSIIVLYDTERCSQADLIAVLDANDCAIQVPAEAARPSIGAVRHVVGDTVKKTVVNAVIGTVVKATVEPPVLSLLKAARSFR